MIDSLFLRVSMASTLLLFCSGSARADEPLIAHLNNHLQGAIGAEHLSYSELNNGLKSSLPYQGDLDTETGTILASSVSASWQGKLWWIDKLRAGFDVHLVNGDATYNGYLQNLQTGALTPLQTSTAETFSDFELKVGKGFSFFPSGRDLLTPYAGIGLTAWHRNLSGPGGYTEQYRHRFWKAGGEYQIELVKDLVLDIDASYGRMVNARMNPSDLPITFELGSTSIQDYRLGFRYLMSAESYVGLDSYWMHYGYDQSPSYNFSSGGFSGSVLEPTSRTTRDGLLLVFGYAYR
jgi:hypothetical protein